MVCSKPFRAIKNRVRKGKMGVKNLLFTAKKQVFGREKIASGQPIRKLKWCKMQVMFLKMD